MKPILSFPVSVHRNGYISTAVFKRQIGCGAPSRSTMERQAWLMWASLGKEFTDAINETMRRIDLGKA